MLSMPKILSTNINFYYIKRLYTYLPKKKTPIYMVSIIKCLNIKFDSVYNKNFNPHRIPTYHSNMNLSFYNQISITRNLALP